MMYWHPIADIIQKTEELKRSNKLGKEQYMDHLVSARHSIRKASKKLKESLDAKFNSRISYLIHFPVLAYCDEIVNSANQHKDVQWPLLQQEFYNTTNGGEDFFVALDDALQQAYTPAVYEVFFFLLKSGFKGQLIDNEAKRDDYIEQLEANLKGQDNYQEVSIKELIDLSSLKASEEIIAKMIKHNPLRHIKRYLFLYAGAIMLLIYLIYLSVLAL
ncbi:DotU family type IV/VI secretion system protein [Piscirickettsia litoralis]|nr:DotU family type IV/VI secretion system protein [Piscirickettsia litoralis]